MSKPISNNAKDPNRPRRKKARRACYACQRAHLTCGDERPCQRCIKRGLADACQDGIRKKAKYLHDTPNEALAPGAANHFVHGEVKRASFGQQDHSPTVQFYPTQNFNMFNAPMTAMLPPTINERSSSFTSQPTMSTMSLPTMAWHETLFGAEDPGMLNFDIASMNFGNHYGALEFGMLDRMANGVGHTPESDQHTQRGSVTQFTMPFGSISESPQLALSDHSMLEWASQPGLYNQLRKQQSGPPAFTIETNQQYHSPNGHLYTNSPDTIKHSESSSFAMPVSGVPSQAQLLSQPARNLGFQSISADMNNHSMSAPVTLPPQATTIMSKKRPRDPTQVYTTVTTPHPYTANFHHLITYLQGRFGRSAHQTLAIAQSLASIRPSFIATTKTLNTDDLVFMEKCFQRTLLEYENFIDGVGTPTIVARRTGAIAAVGKEFQILTGWKKSVLLGRETNLNVNTGRSGTDAALTNKSTGTNTPSLQQYQPTTDAKDPQDLTKSHPVFLAELLDDDSVVQFYEGFSRLAFGDSRGSVMGRCKLLKYRTREDEAATILRREAAKQDEMENISPTQTHDSRPPSKRSASEANFRKGIAGEKSMQKLGDNDGKVDCAYCWTVKRDVFDIPMMIVMNFLPCI
ncbi:hypothetical protein BT93_L4248 [Corymbia citriodora subsp. variegata]|uniref:Zn(2)-C6 fungal-type domain-containing protein n=1 Tax=Corymbia citriodora subsp. variegata TaxID=360336 RepID=A0A8T0CG18_CORYI|nr:hypothetical protein BT93_L4248 [Corymbia citriodora subsp. variegata]